MPKLYTSSKHVSLDLNKVDIYCWENNKSLLIVEHMIKLLNTGFVFPPVLLWEISSNEYILDHWSFSSRIPTGGHHRVASHYLANKPLESIILGVDDYIPNDFFKFKSLRLVDEEKVSSWGGMYCFYKLAYEETNQLIK